MDQVSYPALGLAATILGLILLYFAKTPKEGLRELDLRVDKLEAAHNAFVANHAGSFARVDETVKHLVDGVKSLNTVVGELRNVVQQILLQKNTNDRAPRR